MNTQTIIFIIAILMIVVIAFACLGRGPRVTQITRERTSSKDSEQDQ